jgi:hypothetical protein
MKKFLLISIGVFLFTSNLAVGADVTRDVDNLTNKKIYFGHQSVGLNLIDGLQDIGVVDSKFPAIETKSAEDIAGAGLYHARVGQNLDPKSKIDEFVQLMRSGIAEKVDIAFLKLCYVDIDAETDVDAVFSYYVEEIEKLQSEYPQLKIIHLTGPLKTTKSTWKTKIKTLIGAENIWEYSDNIKRNSYRELILDTYHDVFDIAKYVSTGDDGYSESFTYNDKKYLSLREDYTDDGGHLNVKGRSFVAEKLVNFISEIR